MKQLLTALTLFVMSAVAVAADAPVPNPGNTAWVLLSTVLVTLMAIPGLALFYGGLVRSKNILSVLMQTFVVFALFGVLWTVFGYTLAFTGGSPFIGGLDKLFLLGIICSVSTYICRNYSSSYHWCIC